MFEHKYLEAIDASHSRVSDLCVTDCVQLDACASSLSGYFLVLPSSAWIRCCTTDKRLFVVCPSASSVVVLDLEAVVVVAESACVLRDFGSNTAARDLTSDS